MKPLKTLLIVATFNFEFLLPAYSQDIPRLSLREDHASLLKVLEDIEDITGYTYGIDQSALSLSKPITIVIKDATLTEILGIILKDQPLFCKIIGHSINIRAWDFVHGRVQDGQGRPLASVTITSPGSLAAATMSNEQGVFQLRVSPLEQYLVFSSVGYETQQIRIPDKRELLVRLQSKPAELGGVIVSNGFEDIPLERATGSFFKLSADLIDRRNLPGVIDRMDGVTPGLLVNTNVVPGTNQSAITIRGRSTIFSNPNPLVVTDNFPYSGDINNINPEDIESITVLKDAAAASIWGTRAANGVIVIKTKHGSYNQAPHLVFTTSLTVGQRPNIYYTPIMGSADYIGMEEYLYAQGFYYGLVNDPGHPALSPAVEIMLSGQDTAAGLGALRTQDTRRDVSRYYYRASINQQYWLGLSGGSSGTRYFISAGLDRDLSGLTRNSYDRITVNGNNSYQLGKKLELDLGIALTSSTTYNNNTGGVGVSYPYLRLTDEAGGHAAVPFHLRNGYVDTVGGGQLLDWHYRPLDELADADNTTPLIDYRLSAGLRYQVLKGLQVEALYQYNNDQSDQRNLQSQQTYYTRNLINEFTQIDAYGQITRPIPLGDILDKTENNYQAHNARLQAEYEQGLGDHHLKLLAGAELQAVESQYNLSRLYGYNPVSQSSQPVSSFTTLYPQYSSLGDETTIPYLNTNSAGSDHYLSAYINGGYTFRQRYILTGSARLDQSNLFGVNTNQKTIPLWSAGVAWEPSREGFYNIGWLPFLKLRLTDGYNGNVFKAVSAYTTAASTNAGVFNAVGIGNNFTNTYGAPSADITNPPNPDLRWEKVQVVNAGLDFATRQNRLEGSFDYYIKNGQDLIGASGLDPTTGNTQYTGNVANMVTRGIEINLRTRASIGVVEWNTVFLFNDVRDKVTRYLVRPGTIPSFFNPGIINPLAGKPLYSVYALRWAGLDPTTGDPQGWLNGHASNDYTNLIGSADYSTLEYKGPVNPPFFGSWRHSLSWKGWGLSFMLAYKFGDYFRRSSIQYYELFNGLSQGHPDFAHRWQKSGDEKYTYIPSMIYPANTTRDQFYSVADVLVEKADLIRLQDIELSYDCPKRIIPRLPVQSLRVYLYANNIGLLWTANHQHIDPDAVSSLPNPRSLALGVKMTFK